jgi:hypothetical protein
MILKPSLERLCSFSGDSPRLQVYSEMPFVLNYAIELFAYPIRFRGNLATKDFTETIKMLAGMSLFVIAGISNPKSSPLET